MTTATRPDRMMAFDGPRWGRPWGVGSIVWNSAATAYFPVRLYLRVWDHVLFLAWYRSRPWVWKMEDMLGATGSLGGDE